MSAPELSFVIPTYRLRDVSETITQYDQHFWRNGHAVRMIVFDDSTPATQEPSVRAASRSRWGGTRLTPTSDSPAALGPECGPRTSASTAG
jgi:hypothetical protein